jgi:hypothetical protein
MEVRCIAEIGDGRVRIHRDANVDVFPARTLELSPGSTIRLKDETFKLEILSSALIHHNADWLNRWFDERGQLDAGVFLYESLFGAIPHDEISNGARSCQLRILTDDEFLARLPWNLLVHHGVFLATAGWSVVLGGNQQGECELPPSPKLLIAAPQPEQWPDTQAGPHIAELQDLLSAADVSYIDNSRLRVATSWKTFLAEIGTFQPDLVYYYGHGTGDRHSTRLVFADDNHATCEVSVADFAAALRHQLKTPLLAAYINCCQGDAGGILGAGRQLVDTAFAVLTNRTTAYVSAARAQALAFWDSLIVRGVAPHQALLDLNASLGKLELTLTDYRWMTPVLHCRYGAWRANPPSPLSRQERDPDWKLKLDRVNQFSRVFFQTHQMLFERRPKAIGYLWFGKSDQGLDIFHERLNRELQEKLQDVLIYEVRPEWPEELADPPRSFADMLNQAFEVTSLDHLTGRVRAFSRQRTGQRTLVYVRHTPVLDRQVFDPGYLPAYLEWWAKNFVARLPENCHALLGVSYAVQNPGKFHEYLISKLALPNLNLADAVLVILDALERVTVQDLRDFIRTHNIKLPDDLQQSILEKLLAETDGSYERVIEEMKHLESSAWRASLIRNQRAQTGDEEDIGI